MAYPPYGSVPAVFSIHLTAGTSLDDIRSCRWPGSLIFLVNLWIRCRSVPGDLSVRPRSSPPQILGPTPWNRLTFPLRLPVGTPVIHSWFQVSVVAPIYWTSLALCCMTLFFNVLFLWCSVHLTTVIWWCSILCPGVLLQQGYFHSYCTLCQYPSVQF